MRVALLRNLHEERNISMKLMGDRLEHALCGSVDFVNVRPWWPSTMRADDRWGSKLVGYASRYFVYPITAPRVHADIYHIVDHAYGQLAWTLPPDRTVANCHDLMLLKLARGDFGHREVPPVAAPLFGFAVSHLRQVHTIVTISQATADGLIEMLDVSPRKIRVIYPPVDQFYRPKPAHIDRDRLRRECGLDSRPALFHLGNNWFYKNIEGLIRGFAIARERSREALVLVKGGKRLSDKQRVLASSLGVLDAIIEPGPLEIEQIQKYYWACDALVFPSLWEGFGWPVVEAMASGLPVVCGRAGALVEAAGDAARMVDPNDPEDIAHGIETILADGALRDALVARGFANVRRFQSASYAAQWLDVYREISSRSGAV